MEDAWVRVSVERALLRCGDDMSDQQAFLILHPIQDAMPHGLYKSGFNPVYAENGFVI